MSEIRIGRLSVASVVEYRAIRLEALQRAPDAFGSVHDLEAARPLAAFEERLAGSIVFGAYSGETLIGMAGLAVHTGPKERHKAFLWGVYIRADAHRRGVGKALVGSLLDQAPDAVEQVTLTVAEGNDAAQALYRKLGFVVYGIEPKAFKTPDGYRDEILMIKFLTLS